MSELQKYEIVNRDGDLVGRAPDGSSIGHPPVAELIEGMVIYFADDVDAARAADKLLILNREALLEASVKKLAEQEATIERMRGAIEWCTKIGVFRNANGICSVSSNWQPIEVPAEFADLICAKREE